MLLLLARCRASCLYQIGSASKASVHAILQVIILELCFVNTYVRHVTYMGLFLWLARNDITNV